MNSFFDGEKPYKLWTTLYSSTPFSTWRTLLWGRTKRIEETMRRKDVRNMKKRRNIRLSFAENIICNSPKVMENKVLVCNRLP